MKTAQSQKLYTSAFGVLIGLLLTSSVALVTDNRVVTDLLNYPGRSLSEVDSWFGSAEQFDQVLGETITAKNVSLTRDQEQVIGIEQELPNLKSKLDSTKEAIDAMSLSYQLVTSDTLLIALKWDSLTIDDTNKSLDSLINSLSNLSNLDLLTRYWGWSQTDTIRAKTINIRSNLVTTRSILATSGMQPVAYDQLKLAATNLESVVALIGSETDKVGTASLYGQYAGILDTVLQLDGMETELKGYVASGDLNGFTQLRKKLSIANKLPHSDSILIKDGFEGVQDALALVGANRILLAQNRGEAFFVTWLTDSPVRVKTLVHNPSILSRQDVAVKYYLPYEVTEKDVLNHDRELEIKFDADKKQYYVEGDITVAGGDTRVVQAELVDVWRLNQESVDEIKSQVNALINSLNDSKYFIKAVELGGLINSDLKTYEMAQKGSSSVEERVIAFRRGQIVISEMKQKLVQLQNLSKPQFWDKFIGFSHWGEVLVLGIGLGFVTVGVFGLKPVQMPGSKRTNPGRSKPTYQFNVFTDAIDSSDL